MTAGAARTAERARIAERERLLDDALADSFPASDPISSLEPAPDLSFKS